MDKVARIDDLFKLGEFYVAINNYSSVFETKKIEEFKIEVESFWNGVIEDLYAEVIFENYPELSFQTPVTALRPWKKGTLVGFFEASLIDEDKVAAEIVVYYGNSSTKESVDLKIVQGIDYFFYVILLFIILISAGIVWRITVFVKRYKRLKR
jgi:hypothetical protein